MPSDINLLKLHDVIQVAMGWTNSHLHQFMVGRTFYGIPDEEKDMREWIGRPFDAEAFSVDAVNEDIKDWRKHGLPSLEDL